MSEAILLKQDDSLTHSTIAADYFPYIVIMIVTSSFACFSDLSNNPCPSVTLRNEIFLKYNVIMIIHLHSASLTE